MPSLITACAWLFEEVRELVQPLGQSKLEAGLAGLSGTGFRLAFEPSG
jgi:hypothetical protein